jgi:DNA-binding HxlR family transcriptional regulator
MVEGEIIAVPALSQATVIQHLRELKRAGFIQGRIFGAKARYHIDWETIQKLDSQVSAFLHMMRIGREQSHES